MVKKIKLLLLLPSMALVLQGCQSNYSQKLANKQMSSNSQTVQVFNGQSSNVDYAQFELVSAVQSYLGTPYVYGGTGKRGLDCSSLMQNSFAKLGINIPRTAKAQYQASSIKPQAIPEPGDLLFFDIKNNGRISHVGMYIGDGKMIHASLSKKQVKTSDVNLRYWQTKLKAVGSFLQ